MKTKRKELEDLAEEKMRLFYKIEKEVFNFTVATGGKIMPKYPKYWYKKL